MAHDLPSAGELTSFTAFFKAAHFTRAGDCVVSFALPEESRHAALELAADGMALNLTVWATELPDSAAELARLVGLARDDDEGTK